jgi:hypothetical protein
LFVISVALFLWFLQNLLQIKDKKKKGFCGKSFSRSGDISIRLEFESHPPALKTKAKKQIKKNTVLGFFSNFYFLHLFPSFLSLGPLMKAVTHFLL